MNQLDGRPGLPSDPLVPVHERGVDGRPTLVVNAETLAQLALLARYGADWFRSVGTPDDPGTFLVSLTGSRASRAPARRGGGAAWHAAAGRADQCRHAIAARSAVLVGGYHGTWLPLAAVDVPLCRGGLAPYGATPGAGVVHVLDRGRARCARARRSRRTSPGSRPASAVRASTGCRGWRTRWPGWPCPAPTRGWWARSTGSRALVRGRGACAHPDGTARFVASTMRVFAGHVEAHLRGECHALGGAA